VSDIKTVAMFGESVSVSMSAPWNASFTQLYLESEDDCVLTGVYVSVYLCLRIYVYNS